QPGSRARHAPARLRRSAWFAPQTVGPGPCRTAGLAALAHPSSLTRRFQAGELAGVQIEPSVETLLDSVSDLLFVHNSIPFALEAAAKACAAREQWVLTLP